MSTEEPKYDVALSFAGEDRSYVENVAESLRNAGVRVFYDDYEKAALWGKDLYSHLDHIYRRSSRYCVLFISAAYAAKVWTNHERQSAQARALVENTEYVLPARFDDTELPGLRPTIGYIDLRDLPPHRLARTVIEKLGLPPISAGFPTNIGRLLKYRKQSNAKPSTKGRVREISHSFYEVLEKMTESERRTVGGVFAFGCDEFVPNGIHISRRLLGRMTKLSEEELLENLATVRSLNIRTTVRAPITRHHEGELLPDDQDILVRFRSHRLPEAVNATAIAYDTVQCLAGHFCIDHGLDIVVGLDFHLLAEESLPLLGS